MAAKHGNLSINSDNIFPIIKKWLYSDHDIFFRELISNGCDAITKLKKLDMMGEYALADDYKAKIQVIVNPEEKTLKFIDNGIGMTAAEVEEYINQIAFSGATDFIEKYKDKANEDQIIGHFGLGFYSAFMVADEVHIDSLSYQDGAQAVHWECDGGTEFDMEEGPRTEVGTEITLHINEDCLEFCNEYKAKEVIKKYCSFMPTEIYLSKANTTETQIIKADEKLDTDEVVEEIAKEKEEDEQKLKIKKRPELLNETQPLWTKHPNECTREEYLEFYRKVFQDYKEPLFWIHLNMDYPFNMKGILYFPKINMEYESIEGTIKLYNNQVFIPCSARCGRNIPDGGSSPSLAVPARRPLTAAGISARCRARIPTWWCSPRRTPVRRTPRPSAGRSRAMWSANAANMTSSPTGGRPSGRRCWAVTGRR